MHKCAGCGATTRTKALFITKGVARCNDCGGWEESVNEWQVMMEQLQEGYKEAMNGGNKDVH